MEGTAEKVKSWATPVLLAIIVMLMSLFGQTLNRIEASLLDQDRRMRNTEVCCAVNGQAISSHEKNVHGNGRSD